MSKVRIVRLLCPKRHAIMGAAYVSEHGAELPEKADSLREVFAVAVKLGMNPWCGLCYSRDLRVEDNPTIFATMEEAMPFLKESERHYAKTREFFKASKG